MIAFMIHGVLFRFLCFDIFRDKEVSQLVEAVANLFDLFVGKIPFAEVFFTFLDREHGNPLVRFMRRVPYSSGSFCRFGEVIVCLPFRPEPLLGLWWLQG